MRKTLLMLVLGFVLAVPAMAAMAADAPATDCQPTLDLADLTAPEMTPAVATEAGIQQPLAMASTSSCEQNCRQGYRQCLVICSKNPCLISCEDQLMYCLQGC